MGRLIRDTLQELDLVESYKAEIALQENEKIINNQLSLNFVYICKCNKFLDHTCINANDLETGSY